MHEAFFINSVEHFSYLAIFIFAAFAGYILPIPEEILLVVVGYMAYVKFIHIIPATIVMILALIVGDNILYNLVLKNNKHVHKLIHEVLSLKIISRNRNFMEKHVEKAIFFSRFFPFLRFVGPVFAGYVKAPKKVFLFYNSLAIIIYSPLIISIGYFFHNYFDWILNHIEKMRHVIIILIWIIIGLIITRVVDYIFRKVHPDED